MTAPSIADLTVTTLTETIARAIAKYPAEKGRIERAAQLIATGHVDQISTDLWAVRSQTDETVYIVDATGCPCVDAKRNPTITCKHAWACDLLTVAAERARRLAERESVTHSVTRSGFTEGEIEGRSVTVSPSVDGRAYLARLIEERAARARIVYAQGARPIDDDKCRLLDEHIARLRANMAPVTFRTVAA